MGEEPSGFAVDEIREECGVAGAVMKMPVEFYVEKYKTNTYLADLLSFMIFKERNRGQDTAGLVTVRYGFPREEPRLFSDYAYQTQGNNPAKIMFVLPKDKHTRSNAGLGHVRYATHSIASTESTQPVLRLHSRPIKQFSFGLNGNFANNREQRDSLMALGLVPETDSDLVIMRERFAHEISREYNFLRGQGKRPDEINANFTLENVVARAHTHWKGGYAVIGLLGNGTFFALRDPNEIRPLLFYEDDEIFVVASESTPIVEGLGLDHNQRKYISPLRGGQMIEIKPNQEKKIFTFAANTGRKECDFEHIYFARATSEYIRTDGNLVSNHTVRKILGHELGKAVFPHIADIGKLVVSPIPNTAKSAVIGVCRQLSELSGAEYDLTVEKDEDLRTFIQAALARLSLTQRAYTPIFDSIEGLDQLIVEDSLVKGNTVENVILPTYIRAGARNIILASTCPPIKYPCCYGIEMSKLGEFIYFRATIEAIKENSLEDKLDALRKAAFDQQKQIDADPNYIPERNLVAEIYSLVPEELVLEHIARIATPKNIKWDGKLRVVYNSVPAMKRAIGNTEKSCSACMDGKNPVPEAYRVLNQALINFFEKKDKIAY